MTAGVLPYLQFALGSASGEALPEGRWYFVAKTCRVGRSYFLDPAREWSVWSNNTKISLPGQVLAKGAEISNWVMSVCDTYTWLAKIGMVAQRAVVDKIFNIASTIYLAQSYQAEGAKWWTGLVVNPLNGTSTEFSGAHKVRSLFNLTVTTAYALVTAISVAQMVGYVIPAASFYIFASLSVAASGAVAGHFWEELMIKQ